MTFRASQRELVATAEYDWSSVEHTSADGFDYMSRFIDYNFTAHSTMTRLLTDITLQLLSAARLPVDVRQLSTSLQRILSTLPLDGVSLNDDVTRLLGQFHRVYIPSQKNLDKIIFVICTVSEVFLSRYNKKRFFLPLDFCHSLCLTCFVPPSLKRTVQRTIDFENDWLWTFVAGRPIEWSWCTESPDILLQMSCRTLSTTSVNLPTFSTTSLPNSTPISTSRY